MIPFFPTFPFSLLHQCAYFRRLNCYKKGNLARFYLNPAARFNQIDEMLQRKAPGDKLPENVRKELAAEWTITGHMIRKQLGEVAAQAWHLAEEHILKVDDAIASGADEIEAKTRSVNEAESRKFGLLVVSMVLNTLGLLLGSVREYYDKFRGSLTGSAS